MEAPANIVRVQCAGCQSTIKAPVKYRGKTVRCPKCGNGVKIPPAAKAPLSASPIHVEDRNSSRSDSSRRTKTVRRKAAAVQSVEEATFLDDALFEEEQRNRPRSPNKSKTGNRKTSGGGFDDTFGTGGSTTVDEWDNFDDLGDYEDYGEPLPPQPRRRQKSDESKPRKKKKKKPRPEPEETEHAGAFAFESGVLNAGVLGGIGAMVGAAVWFVLGLKAGILFYYPPVLFVIGLIAFFRGLFGLD